MPDRLLCADAHHLAHEHERLPLADVDAGDPTAAVTTLGQVSGVDVGLWEMTVGTARDTEVDEVFVVLRGTGNVTFEDGQRVDLMPGTVVRLRAGERTTWVVTSTLRKVWIV